MEEVLAKGVNFFYSKKYIESEYGTGTWNKVMNSLTKEEQEIWIGGILVNKSYPFSAFKSMVSALTRELGIKEHNEIARIYEYIADQSLNKIYKIFFHFSNPAFVIRNYPKLWNNFFSTGKVEVPVAEKGHAVLKFILPQIFLDWLPPACLGYSKKAVEMAGGKNMTMKELGKTQLNKDSWEIVYELTWSE